MIINRHFLDCCRRSTPWPWLFHSGGSFQFQNTALSQLEKFPLDKLENMFYVCPMHHLSSLVAPYYSLLSILFSSHSFRGKNKKSDFNSPEPTKMGGHMQPPLPFIPCVSRNMDHKSKVENLQSQIRGLAFVPPSFRGTIIPHIPSRCQPFQEALRYTIQARNCSSI
jgi:hypothetical protein